MRTLLNYCCVQDKLIMANRIVLNEEDVPGAKLTKDPSTYSIEELKRWLECHGLEKGGKENELVERV